MTKFRRNKWNRRFCKWMASVLTTVLLVNQIGISVLAEESGEEICLCVTHCSEDSVNEGCPVCTGLWEM